MSRFPSTNWPLVTAIRQPSSSTVEDAMEAVCRQYWQPLYVFLRQRGHGADEAEDLTQSFFVHVVSKRILERAQPQRGRLRTLLLVCLKHFVANEQHRQRATKRGGSVTKADQRADGRPMVELADDVTPERIYERQWAITLLGRVLDELRAEFVRTGKARLFEALRGQLVDAGGDAGYRDAAVELNASEGALRVAVHRLRRRYRDLLRREIARTVTGPAQDIDDEIRFLRTVVQHQRQCALPS